MLRAISVAREKIAAPPIWNPNTVIQYLTDHPPDENNLYQVSRHTAILLLLSSSRRVHDLTLLSIEDGKYIDQNTTIMFWPRFGSKTDTASYRQSGWKLLQNPSKALDCVYWVRRLIQISNVRRNLDGRFLTDLFITTRGIPKAASRTVIGGWIKSILKEAGIEAAPGSVRSAVASLNWLEQFPIDKILETGNWKQEHTFRKYYRKIILDQPKANKRVSLTNYFDSIR